MRFSRRPKSEGYVWTARKESAFLNRHKRIAKRIERDIPLFADQYKPQAETDIDAEKARRDEMAFKSDRTMRDLDAKVWRAARKAYFESSPEIRGAIRAEWNAWRGPLYGQYFIYVVEKHTGEAERRSQRCAAERRALLERIFRGRPVQADLSL
jgi:hypothetical protein